MSQGIPSTLGKYEIIREIARSNDIVYEGYDPVMNRRVAVKELAMPVGATPSQKEDRIRRFLREAKAAGSLVHPNIVTVYEVAEENDSYYLAMEFLDGETLRKTLDDDGALSPERAVEIAIEVLRALEFAHKHGVVHRDVKPENIQILGDGTIKLTDFGIARLTFEPNLTMDGQVFGTPSYMSPEQINGKEIDQRSDIFSIGIVLYEMLSGSKPFTGDNVMAISYAIMNYEPPQPSTANYMLWQSVKKALDKSPILRQETAAEMIAELKSVQRSFSSSVLDPQSYGSPPASLTQSAGVAGMAQPQMSPYGQPQMPMAGQPGYAYNQAPYQQPYTPYGTPNPMYQGAVVPPPPVMPPNYPPGYPSQSYANQTPYMTTPYTGGMPPGMGTQVPVYYPPPPRQPLFKPETKILFWKVLFAFVVVGCLAWLLVTAMNAAASSIPSASGSQTPTASASPVANPDLNSSSSGVSPPIESAGPTIESRVPEPEVDLDSVMFAAQERIGNGMNTDIAADRREHWRQADLLYGRAVQVAPGQTGQIKEQAVLLYIEAARGLADSGDRIGARQALNRALGHAAGTGQLESLVRFELDRLDSGL